MLVLGFVLVLFKDRRVCGRIGKGWVCCEKKKKRKEKKKKKMRGYARETSIDVTLVEDGVVGAVLWAS